jgi:opacity protein-like surface antigen
MKKYIIGASAFFVFTIATAQAQDFSADNLSFSVLGGWASHPALAVSGSTSGMDNGFNVGARLGYKLDGIVPWSGFALDADYLYNQSNYVRTGAQLGTHSFMGDLTYHVPLLDTQWNVYGGAGLGAVEDNLYGGLHGASTVFGWQALGGAEYRFTPSTAMFVEYRYQNAHDANIAGAGAVGNTSDNLSVGVKFSL